VSWTRRRVAATVGAAALVAGITFASAVNLPLDAQTMTAAEVGHPCPGTAPFTNGSGPPYSTLSVTMPEGCAGLTLTLRLTRGSTTRTGTATVAGSGATVVNLSGTFDPTLSGWEVFAIVGGWHLPTSWSYTPPPPYIWCTVVDGSGETCAATVTVGVRGGNDFYNVVVTTPSTSWVTWEVSFNLADPFYGGVPTRLGNADLDQYSDGAVNWAYNTANVNDVVRSSPCSALPGELRVTGINSGTSPNVFDQVRNTRTRIFDLLVNVNQAGYFDVIEPGCT
jgi:hypothetical protein